MNSAHAHLVITHLPVFGSILGAFVLAYGMWSKSNHTKNAAYLLFIFSAIGAGIAYITGEGAEEIVENVPGVSENVIEQHENFAVYALVSLIALGIVSLISLIITYKKSRLAGAASVITLFIALIGFAVIARTGYLGGQIRHTEINSSNVQNTGSSENEKQDHD